MEKRNNIYENQRIQPQQCSCLMEGVMNILLSMLSLANIVISVMFIKKRYITNTEAKGNLAIFCDTQWKEL